MADAKITQLTALTSPESGDLLAIVDDPSGTPVTKKITLKNLLVTGAAIGDTSVFNGTSVGIFGANFPCVLDVETTVTDMTAAKQNTSIGALLNPSANTAFNYLNQSNELTTTGTKNFTGSLMAGFFEFDHNGSGSLTGGYGVTGYAFNDSSGAVTTLTGLNGRVGQYGSGNVTNASVVHADSYFEGSGTYTNLIHFHSNSVTVGGGTTAVTNAYGLKVETLGLGTNRYAVYTGTDQSVFNGKVVFNTFLESVEQSGAPSAPSANGVRIYAIDNGAGKTQLMALFSSGAAQQIAIQP